MNRMHDQNNGFLRKCYTGVNTGSFSWVIMKNALVYPRLRGERGGSVVECRSPEREVGGSKPNAAVLCPWVRHFTPRKYWLITQEALGPSRHDWKIVDWDVKPQHKQTNKTRACAGPFIVINISLTILSNFASAFEFF